VVAIGSQEDDDNGFDSGSAYLYDALTGNEICKLLASDGVEFDLFGTSVAIDGDVTVVGAKGYTESHTGSAYVYSGTTNEIIDISYNEDWNLVGLPLDVEDSGYSVLYPESIEGTLYSFSGAYNPATNLINGEGYWLRFNESGSTTIYGTPIYELTISLNEGWNLISGISTPLDITEIQDPDGLIIAGTIYGFTSGGYSNEEILEPGKGYWIRTNSSGSIILIDN
jgi:hypothetical protein